MRLVYSNHFKKRLKKFINKNPQLFSKVNKQLRQLRQDITYPSLKTHKLRGKRADQYAIWIVGDVRITFLITQDFYLLTDVISHDEY